jgi:hypothetical protein
MRTIMRQETYTEYILGWMCEDIEREIQWARDHLQENGRHAGNALCTLGLMAYTEYMGGLIILGDGKEETEAKIKFNTFFRKLGEDYAELIDIKKLNIYDTFRNGLAHEYFVKRTCTIYMLNSPESPIKVKGNLQNGNEAEIPRPVSCGIGQAENGGYYFVVEQYYKDFRKVLEDVYRDWFLTTTTKLYSEIMTPKMSSS